MLKETTTSELIQNCTTYGFAVLNTLLEDQDLPNFELLKLENSAVFYEKDDSTLRSLYHLQNSKHFNEWLVKQTWLKSIVAPFLGPDFYLHQTKINIKNQDTSSIWPFHRDFPFWNVFDHIPSNKMMNIAIFLDDVNAGSGELIVIPGSHTEFLEREEENKSTEYSIDGSASSDLLFNFTDQEIEIFKNKMGSQNIIGPKGTVLAFDANLIHGSGNSLENQSRKLLILTFNSCENLPTAVSERPEYLCSKDHRPIVWR